MEEGGGEKLFSTWDRKKGKRGNRDRLSSGLNYNV